MIANIFRKDAKLLWPLALLVTALHVCAAIPHYLIDQSASPSARLMVLAELLSVLSILAIPVLVVVAMHQDAVPGVRQDWLTRPIRRSDLIFAKLVFVLLLVLAPLWLVDFGSVLADGLGVGEACVAASRHSLAVLCEMALPAMMIGAVTRNFVEAFIVAAATVVAYVLVFQVILAFVLGLRASVAETGAGWLVEAAFYVMAIAGAAIVLCVQYFTRRTVLARTLVGLGGAIVIGWAFMPWHTAFALQRALAPEPTAAAPVQIAFDPQLGRYRLRPGAAPSAINALYIPLRSSGLPDGTSVLLDHADVRITSGQGVVLYRGKSIISVDGLGSLRDAVFEIRAGDADGPSLHQRIYLPVEVMSRVGSQPVRIGLDLSLTLFKPAESFQVPAVGAQARLGSLGRCVTRIDGEGDDVQIACLSAGQQPSCLSAQLEDPVAGLRNPEYHRCLANYAPAIISGLYPDAIHRAGGELRFFDRTGMMHFAVDGAKLAESRIRIQTFGARDHFIRHVETPLVRLPDLTGVAGNGIAPSAQQDLRKLY